MVTLSGLSKQFGAQRVLDSVDWCIPDGARIALVGVNGSGKSTLLKILAGRLEPDRGRISLTKGTRVGYLDQEVQGVGDRTVFDEVMSAFSDLARLEQRCRQLEARLASLDPAAPGYGAVLEEYSRAREEWDARGSYDMEARARAVLNGLGFVPADLSRSCTSFSGGWQMRVALAKLLLQEPHLLLLDEPTNHLDLEARNWLEGFLSAYRHSFVLVAHDRFFLDACCAQVTEISRGKLSDYPCTYSAYLGQREERLRRQEEAYRLQQEEIARIQGFVQRFRYQASKAALVQSRLKQLSKMERIEPPEGVRTMRFRFPQPPRSGRIVVQLKGVMKSYGPKVVLANLDLTLERGRKVAIVGPNGAGKSTLLKILAGVDRPDRGERRIGQNVAISYFDQDRCASLQSEQRVIDLVTARAPISLVPQIRTLLGAFLFGGDAAYKPVWALSGGERTRLALALLLLQPANCLLLDEPTNHLDLSAKEVLLEALRAYEGTLVFVAHDRYFLDELPQEIWEVGSGAMVRYIGNYEEYLAKKALEKTSFALASAAGTKGAGVALPPQSSPTGRGSQRANRGQADPRRWAKQIEQVESAIATKEAELAALQRQVSEADFQAKTPNPETYYSRWAQLYREVEQLYHELERLEAGQGQATADSENG